MNIIEFPKPLPRVHQCGCGSQAFHMCADGRVVCLQCRYIIEGLKVVSTNEKEAQDVLQGLQ